MSCVKIRTNKLFRIAQNLLYDDGYYYFDIIENASFEYTKTLNELTNLNDLVFDFIVPFSLPNTPKNYFLLYEFFHGEFKPLEVEVYNGLNWLSGVFMTMSDADSQSIEIELIPPELAWAKTLSKTYVKDIPSGYAIKTDFFAGIDPTIPAAPFMFSDSLDGRTVAYPLVDYGDLRSVTDEYRSKVGYAVRANGDTETITCVYAEDVTPRLLLKDQYKLNAVDLRPWHYALPIIKQMFCKVGYTLESPVLFSDYGRRILTYILDPKKSSEDLVDVSVNLRDVVTLTQRVPPTRYETDFGFSFRIPAPSNFLVVNRTFLRFSKVGVWDINVKIVYGLIGFDSPDVDYKDMQIFFGAYLMEGNRVVQYLGHHIRQGFDKEVENGIRPESASIELSDVYIKEGQHVEVIGHTNGATLYIFQDLKDTDYEPCGEPIGFKEQMITGIIAAQKHRFFWREFEPNDNPILDGLVYRDTRDVDRELTALDYLKGIAHLLNLKFYTDVANRTIYALQPFEVNLYGTQLEGFFQVSADDLGKIVKNSYSVQNRKSDIKEVKLSFKGSDLHSSSVPISDDGDVVELENPVFRATYLQQYGLGAAAVSGEGALYRSYPPVGDRTETDYGYRWLFPNLFGELPEQDITEAHFPIYLKQASSVYRQQISARRVQEFEIEPRVALNYGMRRQKSTLSLPIRVKNTTINKYNLTTVGHYHPLLSEIVNPSEALPPEALVFSSPESTLYFQFDSDYFKRVGADPFFRQGNLTALFYYKWLINRYSLFYINYGLIMTSNEFFSKTMREVHELSHLGKPYSAVITKLDGFSPCNKEATTVEFLPLVEYSYPCAVGDPDIETEWRDDDCRVLNNPDLLVEYDLTTDTALLTLTGRNDSVIVDVIFEYSTDGETFTVIPNLTMLTAELSPTGSTVLYFRARVEYEECPIQYTPVIYKDLCSNVGTNRLRAQMYINAEGSACVVAEIAIDESIPYTVVEFEVDTGSGFAPYTNLTELCGITSDVIFRLVTTIGNCPEVENQILLNYEAGCISELNEVGLECVEGLSFIRTGTLPIGVATDTIYYQTSLDGDNWPEEWITWNGDDITANYVRARRIVVMCGDCPVFCTPIIYCGDCTLELSIECTDCTLSVVGADLSGCTIEWTGPESFTATGNDILVEIEGIYEATIYCGDCIYMQNFDFVKPNTGTPIDTPVVI